jgi:uncharacterized protein YdeI (YjbR/CyaY-like superfamily)
MYTTVDDFLANEKRWKPELTALRAIVVDCMLTQEIKWKVPCFTKKGKNIVLIHGFKDYCAILFLKGALLQDPENILIQQTETVQFGRQIRFTSVQDIQQQQAIIKAYIIEAITIEEQGLQVVTKPHADYILPLELLDSFGKNKALQTAFEALTPGRQRGYILHFSGAKQSQTRQDRIDNCTAKILNGKGLMDCTCGLSKRMPSCDGSHKILAK